MQKTDYGKEYHSFFHQRLLSDKRYYMFRAAYSSHTYWPFFRNTKKGKFVEFGCGMGQNIFIHRENSTGIDISNFAIKKCAEMGIKAEKGIKKIKAGSVEGVLCCHVMEHLEEPAYYLKQFHRVLKKDGRLVLVLPMTQKPYSTSPPDMKSWHLYAWSIPTIWALLQNIGFKVKIAGFNFASGFSVFYRLPFPFAIKMIKLAGYIKNQREMLIVAEKP